MLDRRLATCVFAAAVVVFACAPTAPATPGPEYSALAPPGAWSAMGVEAPDAAAFRRSAAMRGLVAGDRTAWTTTDDGRWLPAEPIDEAADRIGLLAWHGELVAWADGDLISVSPDGITWNEAPRGPEEGNPSDLLAFQDRLLLLGEGTRSATGAWESHDGLVWTPIAAAPRGLAAAAEMPTGALVAVGFLRTNAFAWTTADTSDWSDVPPPTAAGNGIVSLHDIAAGGRAVVTIGDDDGVAGAWTTRDLATWTRSLVVADPASYLQAIDRVEGGFIISGRRGDRPVVWLSPDGVSWSAIDLPLDASAPGEAAVARTVGDRIAVFGYTTRDEGNGGSSRIGYLVWESPPIP